MDTKRKVGKQLHADVKKQLKLSAVDSSSTGVIRAPDSQCSHLLEVWDDDKAKAELTRQYKSIVVWALDRYRGNDHTQKKRKVHHLNNLLV